MPFYFPSICQPGAASFQGKQFYTDMTDVLLQGSSGGLHSNCVTSMGCQHFLKCGQSAENGLHSCNRCGKGFVWLIAMCVSYLVSLVISLANFPWFVYILIVGFLRALCIFWITVPYQICFVRYIPCLLLIFSFSWHFLLQNGSF